MSGNIGETISNSDLNTCTICKFIIVDFTDCADPEIRCVNLRQQDHLLEAKSRKRLVPQPFRWLYVTSNFIQHCYCGITVNVNKTCHSRSSVVALIADRTEYDVRYTGKLSNFVYMFINGWYKWSESTGRVYERTQTLSTQAWPLSVTDQSSVVHEVSE